MTAEPDPKLLTPAQAWVDEICRVAGLDYRIRSNAGRAAKLGKELREAGGTVAELRAHFGQVDTGAAWWWWRDDWRGKRGQRPTVGQIAENWGAWELPVAVQTRGAVGGMLAYIERLEHGDAH